MAEYIAFYGTLKSSHTTSIGVPMSMHLKIIGQCTIPGRLYKKARYPALKHGNRTITGELYEILEPHVLTILDKYEAIDNEDPALPGFSRQLVYLIEPKKHAWVYYYDGPVRDAELIESGEWI